MKRVSAVKILPDVRQDAARWCEKLAADRSQSGWSIRFTHADIELAPATRLAWRAHCAMKERLPAAPPSKLWSEAATLLRDGWGDPLQRIELVRSCRRQTKEKSMAKKQTRKSISVSKKTYDQAKDLAEKQGISLSQLTEAALLYAIEQHL